MSSSETTTENTTETTNVDASEALATEQASSSEVVEQASQSPAVSGIENMIGMSDLLAAGVYFGHRSCFWNPKMKQYIYSQRKGIHIIDLEQTLVALRKAILYVKSVASKPKRQILFVSTKRSASSFIKSQASRVQMPYVDERWLGGMLTNYKTIRYSVKKLKALQEEYDANQFSRMTKKEGLKKKLTMDKLEKTIGGVKDMVGLPDALFVIDANHEHIAIQEANKLKIPVICVVDTNGNPDGVDYVIPGNDDSMRSIELYTTIMADAIIEGQRK